MDRLPIAVGPAHELRARSRLFRALEEAFPVRFLSGRTAEATAAVAAISFSPDDDVARLPIPRIFEVEPRRSRQAVRSTVTFSNAPLVDSALRGRSLEDGNERGPGLDARDGVTVLAACDDDVVWALSRDGQQTRERTAFDVPEIEADESLRDHVSTGNIMRLLPLVHFLRDVAGDRMWKARRSAATIVIDDPNLHWTSYSGVNYRDLAAHAGHHGYHVVMATIPLDCWYADPRAVAIFRDKPERLSLAIHGNDHRRGELGISDERTATTIAAQALRRVMSFESRTGLRVARIMVPPHEACSKTTMSALMKLGYEGVSLTRAYQWRSVVGDAPHAGREESPEIAGWFPAEVLANGFPIFVRRPFLDCDDITLRVFLGQPIVLYGHAEELRDHDSLAEVAKFVNGHGDVEWTSLTSMTRTNFEHLYDANELVVRPFARAVDVTAREGTDGLTVELPCGVDAGLVEIRVVSAAASDLRVPGTGETSVRLVPREDEATIRIEIRARTTLDPNAIPPPPSRLWPLARRFATEARDRLRLA